MLNHLQVLIRIYSVEKNLNASRPSEHPPVTTVVVTTVVVRGENVKTFGGDHRLQRDSPTLYC